jgi:hypothetical protein
MSKSDVFEFIREYVNENKPEGVYKIFLIIKEPIGEKEIYQISPIYIVEDNSDLLDIHYTNKSKTQWYTTGDSVFKNFENEIGKFIRKYLSYDVYFRNRGITSKSYWLKEKIKEGLREVVKESEDDKELLKSIVNDFGVKDAIKYVGGIKDYINIMFDGDVKKYFEENNLNSYYITNNGMNMYLSDALVSVLDLPDFGKDKFLGDFGWVSGGIRYKLSVYLTQVSEGYVQPEGFQKQKMWRVKGRSGDSGWGFPFITKKQTIGGRGRKQIFKQIIERLGL